jgi:TPP-dependent pyruvate/acetoin dehydrogenase alpha subunit
MFFTAGSFLYFCRAQIQIMHGNIQESPNVQGGTEPSHTEFKSSVLEDYRTCCVSREASLMGRREVLTGKAKFGILGDGKEVPQVALSRVFQKGDWRSGYYRDQTIIFALGLGTVEDYFAQ